MGDDRPLLAQSYDWKKTAWKAVRAGLLAALFAAGSAAANNVEGDDLAKIGVPAGLAGVVVEGARNYFKNRNK